MFNTKLLSAFVLFAFAFMFAGCGHHKTRVMVVESQPHCPTQESCHDDRWLDCVHPVGDCPHHGHHDNCDEGDD